jgi:putative transposase
MVTGRPKAQLILDEAERAQLASMARSRSLSAALVLRARIVLACEVEASNRKVAHRLQLNPATVGKWRKRFVEQRISGLHDELRPGAPRSIDDERVAMLICARQLNLDHLCRLNFDQGSSAVRKAGGCG